ncbi:MAG: DUF1223 domain-containing protein [Rhodospirillales bacterium]|nr:DUF1223 domain-containing protein [Rhodospirillales bacterium]MBO6788190.1 DUF1223 domain-containing protein [Rhodospirillales bacterium]
MNCTAFPKWRSYLTALLVVLALGLTSQARAGEALTVVELYTSQGCSSCPPADTYLGTLVDRPDILALSLHVDYWDYIGWKDPYALPGNTERQRSYARNLGMGYVYTPQMVVQGMAHTTGSNRGAVERLIRELKGAKRLDITVEQANGTVQVNIPGGTFEDETGRILIAAFDKRHENDVSRGENSGRKLAHYNVVRDLVEVGSWKGEPLSMTVTDQLVDMKGRDGCAILVQSTKTGRILGAAKIWLTPQS